MGSKLSSIPNLNHISKTGPTEATAQLLERYAGFLQFWGEAWEFVADLPANGVVSYCFFLVPYLGVSKNRGTPKWMVKIMENPIKVDDLGVPLFSETPISLRRLNFPFCCLFFFSMCSNHSNYSNLESTSPTYSNTS